MSFRTLFLSSLLLLAGCAATNYGDDQFHLSMASHGKDIMWVPSKTEMVHKMLDAAKVGKGDVLYDLGSGDGVIPIEAAKKYGIATFGIEYNPDLVALAKRNAVRSNVANLTSFRQGDIFVEDFSRATVVTLYLGENLNAKLMPRLLALQPGTRVVSNTFRIESWIPDQEITTSTGEKAFLWIVPATIDGQWTVNGLPVASPATLKIRQRKQFFDGVIESPSGKRIAFEDGRITGKSLSFEFKNETGQRFVFKGEIDGLKLSGALNGDQRQGIVGERLAVRR